MKNKFLVAAIVALLLAVGMVLVSCGNCPSDGKCEFDPANPANTDLCYLSFTNGIPNPDMAQAETCLGTTTQPTGKVKCKC
ncbi:MAG: hypothetical protein FWB95_08625 [Treponema sp.]|nr:hypothetical protein [Treponema sp.]